MEVNAENLRQRYNKMEIDELIKLRAEGGLSKIASDILDEILKEKGVSDDRLKELTAKFKEEIQLVEKKRKRSAKWSQKKLLGIPVSSWLSIFFALLIYNTFVRPTFIKTNRTYLGEIINSGTIVKSAAMLVDEMKKNDPGVSIENEEWELMTSTLATCMLQDAKKFLASKAPYLNEQANKQTPMFLSEKFLQTCNYFDGTNRGYLKYLIDSGGVEGMAAELMDDLEKEDTKESEGIIARERIKTILTECMLQEANQFLASGDAFLDEQTTNLAELEIIARLMEACDYWKNP